MIEKVLQELDKWLVQENNERRKIGTLLIKKVVIKVLGQMALIEAKLNLQLLETADVDAYISGEYIVIKKFDELLKMRNRFLDPDSEKVWMPKETQYTPLYKGRSVDGFLADPESVLISKALKAPVKNKNLVIEYLAHSPSQRFFKLAQKYKLDLNGFIKK
ncbi:MAG: hypothetical protein HYW47_07720 [Deltaproteobacteria bacterium]|nr:hypothetical protein [Deltaproteobacteria bacterium]